MQNFTIPSLKTEMEQWLPDGKKRRDHTEILRAMIVRRISLYNASD